MVEQQYYNAKEVALICSIPVSSAYDLMAKLGQTKIGQRRRIECAKLHDYLKTHTSNPIITDRERRQMQLGKIDY